MDLLVFVRLLRRHLRLLVLLALVGAALGAGSALVDSKQAPAVAEGRYYAATNTLAFDSSALGDSPVRLYGNLDQLALVATNADVARRVAEKVGSTPPEVVRRITTVSDPYASTLAFVAVGRDGGDASALADAYSAEYVAYLRETAEARMASERDSLIKRIDQVKQQRAGLAGALANPFLSAPDRSDLEAESDAAANQYRLLYDRFSRLADADTVPPPLTPLQPAQAVVVSAGEYRSALARAALGRNHLRAQTGSDPTTDTKVSAKSGVSLDDPVSRGVLGGVLGLLVGVALALVLERVDSRVRVREDVEEAYRLPVLAEVPMLSRGDSRAHAVLTQSAPTSRAAEAYRAVRSALQLERADEPTPDGCLVVMVASAAPQEGKTTTAANLAVAFAETGLRVLAVNGDFRRPSLREFFELPDAGAEVVETSVPGVSLVANVAPELVASPALAVAALRQVIARQRDRFDVVVLDTAPLLTTNDAIDLLPAADRVVLCARPGRTRAEDARRSRELLDRHHAHLVGAVTVGADAVPNRYYYHYTRDAMRTAEQAPVDAAAIDGDEVAWSPASGSGGAADATGATEATGATGGTGSTASEGDDA